MERFLCTCGSNLFRIFRNQTYSVLTCAKCALAYMFQRGNEGGIPISHTLSREELNQLIGENDAT